MDRRPRLARWQHGTGGGLRSGAISTRIPVGPSSTPSSGPGESVGRTAAGVPSSQLPARGTSSSSSSSFGVLGSPASNGTNPSRVSPSAAGWPQSNVYDSNSSGVQSRYTTGHNVSSGAPVAYRQSPSVPTASPARIKLDRGGLASTGLPGPTFLLTRGGSARSTRGVVAPAELQQRGITSMLDLAAAFSNRGEVRSAMGAAGQTAKELAAIAWAQSRRLAPAIKSPCRCPTHCAHTTNVQAATAG